MNELINEKYRIITIQLYKPFFPDLKKNALAFYCRFIATQKVYDKGVNCLQLAPLNVLTSVKVTFGNGFIISIGLLQVAAVFHWLCKFVLDVPLGI